MGKLKLIGLVLIVVTCAADLWTKAHFAELTGLTVDTKGAAPNRVEVIPGFLAWEGTWNPGITWGLAAGKTVPILVLTIVATLGLLIWFLGTRTRSRFLHIGLSLVIGGALGNLYDRLEFHKVRDFVAMYIESGGERHTWPNYNLADAGIVVGVILICWDALFGVGAKEADAKAQARKAAKEAKEQAAKQVRAQERAGEDGA